MRSFGSSSSSLGSRNTSASKLDIFLYHGETPLSQAAQRFRGNFQALLNCSLRPKQFKPGKKTRNRLINCRANRRTVYVIRRGRIGLQAGGPIPTRSIDKILKSIGLSAVSPFRYTLPFAPWRVPTPSLPTGDENFDGGLDVRGRRA